jgi:putative transposase
MCKKLGVTRAGYYKYLKTKEKPKKEAVQEKQLKECISLIYFEHKKNYGYRKIHKILKKQYNIPVSEKVVRRLMRELGLKSQARKIKKAGPSKITSAGHIYKNILKRDFHTTKLNEKWVTDVTEIPIGEEKLYVSAIMDLHNNEIIGYQDSTVHDVQLVEDTLNCALEVRKIEESLILHSDRGMPYRSNRWHELINDRITPSMSRKANALDNACIESFFSFLKCELREELKAAKDIEEARKILRDYIQYYNNIRIQGVLDYCTPADYAKAG